MLEVHGSIVGSAVTTLADTARTALAEAATLTIDLAEVSFVDRPGVALLGDLRAAGARLVNPTTFVAGLLGGDRS